MANNPIATGMTGRYATALFELAVESNELDAVEKDVLAFRDLLADSEDLNRLIRSPVFSAKEQAGALSTILQKTGFNKLTTNFLELIARNRRLFAVGGMIDDFLAILADHRGEVAAEVTSAMALTDEQMKSLKETLRISTGQDVRVDTSVDPSLLGGLIVKVGSRMIDSSLRTKLNNLKIAMKEVG